VPRSRETDHESAAAEDDQSAAEEAAEEKTPEQALKEKLELDRFVERLRRKYH
jgi:hypothetical protein